eukprot:Colp12_sorted_trinity150504_noHs@4238
MEFLQAKIHQGSLQQLQMLHQNVERLGNIQKSTIKNDEELDSLRATLTELQEKHLKLKLKLMQVSCSKMSEKIEEAGKPNDKVPVPDTHQVIKNIKKRKIEELQDSYRLAGRTIVPLGNRKFEWRFDTAYEERYFESYYVFVQVHATENTLSVYKHTLPYFIPLDNLVKRFLNNDTKKFLSVIQDHLNALVSRRQQLVQLQEAFSLVEPEVKSNGAFNLSRISLKAVEAVAVDLVVSYERLTSTLPSRVQLRLSEDGAPFKRHTTKEAPFYHMPLARALADVLPMH